jgi:hypothetical protein
LAVKHLALSQQLLASLAIMDLNARGNQPFRFLDLIPEVRLQVYEHLVVVGKVFYTPDDFTLDNDKRFKDWTLYRKPELQLLRVCKQIHSEVEEVYLSKNLFVLPDFFHFRSPINTNPINSTTIHPSGHIPFPEKPLFSDAASKLLKNVSISFNTHQPSPVMVGHSRWEYLGGLYPERSFDSLSPGERLEYAHRSASGSLSHAWIESIEWLTGFLAPEDEEEEGEEDDGDPEARNLLNLEIDFTNTYCPIGCCRLPVHVGPLFANLRPANVTLLGLRNEEERNGVLGRVSEYYCDGRNTLDLDERLQNLNKEQVREVHCVKFDPEEDVWAKWKKVIRRRSQKRR